MKTLSATAALLFLVPMLAPAQDTDHHDRGQGYFFFGLGATHHDPLDKILGISTTPIGVAVSTGFGGEGFVYKGLGLGAEVGYAGPDWNFGSSGMGVGSADVSYHFLPRTARSRVEPFVTGGYSLYFGHGETTGFNVGGGANVWLRKHLGLRLELREQAHAQYLIPRVKDFVAFRVGMTFR